MTSINLKIVEEKLREDLALCGEEAIVQELKNLQIAIYVMCGGGLLGKLAVEDPWNFYLDDRTAKLPYKRAEILQSIEVLKVYAKVLEEDINTMPPVSQFHSCGIF